MTPLEVPTLAYPGTPQAPLRGFFMPHDTWVKSYRKFREWEWYKTPGMFHLFHHLIYGANHKDNKWQGMEIKRGQIVTGRDKLSQQTGLSPRQIRTCLHRLQESQELTIKTTNRFSIITICNYDKYQVAESDSDQQSDQQATSKRPASDHKQECIKNVKNNNLKKGGNNRKKFIPPTESDVIQYFEEKGYLVSVAKKAFDFYDVADWKDSRGKQILNWKQKMLGVWLKDENKDTAAIVWRIYE